MNSTLMESELTFQEDKYARSLSMLARARGLKAEQPETSGLLCAGRVDADK